MSTDRDVPALFLDLNQERKIMRHARIRLFLISLVVVPLLLLCFSIRFEFSLWVLRPARTINVFPVLFIAVIVFAVYSHIEPFTLKIRRYDFTVRRLPVRHLRIAHLSDTHVHFPYPQLTAQRILHIIDLINKEDPDLVFLTGDLMSDDSRFATMDIATIVNALKRVTAPLFVCFGNHDVARHVELISALHQIGATTLEQQTAEVKVGDASIYISGLKPSLVLSETAQYVDELSRSFNGDPGKCHFLLAHMPDAADSAAATRLFDAQFSGHSHGGQTVLPWNAGGPFLPPGSLIYTGVITNNYRAGDMLVHVSRGIGITPLPYPMIRFLCPPEFSVLNISAPST
jgi:predicted MPP superfamily phosphohydrolase